MSIKLHYGPPGTYKTSGAIFDDLPIAVKEGRVLITNIRGLNDAELVKSVLIGKKKPVDDDFEIIYLDTKEEKNRDKMRRFHHWAPQDSYFIIDEINTIFPKDWRTSKLKDFDLHNGTEKDLKNKKNFLTDRHGQVAYDVETEQPIIRPQNIVEALEMHRHFNFDFSLTSPSYKKFHPIFHDVAEMAYGHINRAIIGITGYWETVHTADNTGKSKTDIISIDNKKIPSWVFKLYQSTATGEVRDTTAGINIFLKPKVIAPIILSIAVIIYGITELNRVGLVGDEETKKEVKTNVKTRIKAPLQNSIQKQNNTNATQSNNINNSSNGNPENTAPSPPVRDPDDFLQDYKIFLTGILMGERRITIKRKHEENYLNVSDVEKLGYKFTYVNLCLGKVTYLKTNTSRVIMCQPQSNQGSMGQQVNFNPFSNQDNKTLEN